MKYLSLLGVLILVNFSFSQGEFSISGEMTPFDNRGGPSIHPDGVKFNIDDVDIAHSLLTTYDAKTTFEFKLAKEITYFPEFLKDDQFIPCANNGLIQTVHICFDQHRPLVLTPDVIWMAITQGTSIHINENFDSLKDIIFTAEKPTEIHVRNDELVHGGENWANLVSSFSDSTRKYVKDDYYEFFVPEFSTTRGYERTAYQVTMLEGFSQAFKYSGGSGCGIPYVTLQGDREDWQQIYENLRMLEGLGLEDWAESLRPVIQEFINVYDRNVDVTFWKDIYKNIMMYGTSHISGWIIKFFPYVKETRPLGDDVEIGVEDSTDIFANNPYMTKSTEIFVKNSYLEGDQYLLCHYSSNNIPTGISKIDITWHNDYAHTTHELVIQAGFFGIKQYPDKSLEPVISWALLAKDAPKSSGDVDSYWMSDTEHRDIYWSPRTNYDILDSARYYGEKYSSQTEGNEAVKKLMIYHYNDGHSNFGPDYFRGLVVDITILSNGNIGKVKIVDRAEDFSAEELAADLKLLNEKWTPALVGSKNMHDWSKDDLEVKVPANSVVRLTF
jgi:hypothetical protein